MRRQRFGRDNPMEPGASTTQIIGLHPVPFTEEFLREFIIEFARGESEEAIQRYMEYNRNHVQGTMENLHLIEMLTDFADAHFGQVSQDDPNQPTSQVPYAERFLSPDGMEAHQSPVQKSTTDKRYRVAFFLHFVDVDRPLYVPARGSGGRTALRLPDPTPLPDRLARLCSYELPD
jgi:hypothetical protein